MSHVVDEDESSAWKRWIIWVKLFRTHKLSSGNTWRSLCIFLKFVWSSQDVSDGVTFVVAFLWQQFQKWFARPGDKINGFEASLQQLATPKNMHIEVLMFLLQSEKGLVYTLIDDVCGGVEFSTFKKWKMSPFLFREDRWWMISPHLLALIGPIWCVSLNSDYAAQWNTWPQQWQRLSPRPAP